MVNKSNFIMTKRLRAKEPIKIRFKNLANGNKSIYLDCYQEGQRRYEFLKLYLVPEVTPTDKHQNKETLKIATAIKAQRLLDLASGKASIKSNSKQKMSLKDFLKLFSEVQAKRGCKDAYQISKVVTILDEYQHGKWVTLEQIDKAFILGFIDCLSKVPNKHKDEPLKKSTQKGYYVILDKALNYAVRNEYIPKNPCTMLDSSERIKTPESTRPYLTIDEVRQLINTPCKKPIVKAAFLFSCFCGLRISDIKALTWGNVVKDSEGQSIHITQYKTKQPLILPLSDEALKWMPTRPEQATDNDKVFSDLVTRAKVNDYLKPWAKEAGISKNVSFHVSRHTFATLMLTLGADLYTTSKLLGHTKVETTEIYAKIIDKKKIAAVNLADGVFSSEHI